MTALDREMALAVLREHLWADMKPDDPVLGLLEECVLPARAQTLDREALEQELRTRSSKHVREQVITDAVDAVFALLRPADAVVLDRATLTQAVGRVLFNTSNYPASAQPYLLGRDISPLRTKIVDSILAQQLETQL